MDQSTKNESGSFFPFISGIAIGALLGVLFAPKKGSETRAEIKVKLDELKEKFETYFDSKSDTPGAETNSEQEELANEAQKLMSELEKILQKIK
jgi:gas vesicle protein